MARPEALATTRVLKRAVNPDGTLYGWRFWCPGCKLPHAVTTGWSFNGNEQLPTFAPSVLVRWDEGEERTPKQCHLFVRSGELMFLDDCTHELKGQTVPMVDYDAHFAAWARQL